jgi:hypothetical protein
MDEYLAWAATRLPADEYAELAAFMSRPDMVEGMRDASAVPPESERPGPSDEELRRLLARYDRCGPAWLAEAWPEHSAEWWADMMEAARDRVEIGVAFDPEIEANAPPVLRIIIKLCRLAYREAREQSP